MIDSVTISIQPDTHLQVIALRVYIWQWVSAICKDALTMGPTFYWWAKRHTFNR